MIGGGTVGSGVFHAWQQNGDLIAARLDVKLNFRKIAVKAHVENIFVLEVAQACAVAGTMVRVARGIGRAFAPHGLSVYQANGAAAGQTVLHYHVRLVPRYAGDGMALTWPVKNPAREKLEEYAAKIRASLAPG